MRRPWQLQLLWRFGVGTGAGMVALVMGATVVNRWFHRHRGLLIGILTASTATGQLLFLPLLAKLVEDHDWRAATWCVAAAAVALVPLAVFFVKDDPAPLGLVGAVPALLLFHAPFGFNAILGLIGLAGILMRNTLMRCGSG
jgi:sugar phosphate permease